MIFNMAWYVKGYNVSDYMPFRELTWYYDRLKKQLDDEKQGGNGMDNALKNMMG